MERSACHHSGEQTGGIEVASAAECIGQDLARYLLALDLAPDDKIADEPIAPGDALEHDRPGAHLEQGIRGPVDKFWGDVLAAIGDTREDRGLGQVGQ